MPASRPLLFDPLISAGLIYRLENRAGLSLQLLLLIGAAGWQAFQHHSFWYSGGILQARQGWCFHPPQADT